MTRVLRGIVAATIAISLPLGQVVVTQVDKPRPAFAEASVRAIDTSTISHMGRELTSTTFVDRSSLLQFIVNAYLDADGAGACALKIANDVGCEPIVGPVPAWVRTDKFEIAARIPAESLSREAIDRLLEFRFTNSPRRNVYPAPVQSMLQRLLEDTFALEVRRERREIPVWAITTRRKELTLAYSAGGAHGWVQGRGRGDSYQLDFQASTLKDTAAFFSGYLDRPVIDLTDLDAEYDFTFEFKADPRAPWPKRGLPIMAGFDAERLARGLDALGFALESAVATFDVLVIEHVQRPLPDQAN